MKNLDTYVLCEISKGNPLFLSYLTKEIVITEITLAEFYGVILREFNEQTADYWMKKLLAYTKPVPFRILTKAMKFRVDNKKKNISFFDAVGYIFAKENGIKFVTGDKEFENLPGVEFVKK